MFPYTYSDLYLLRILIPELLIQKELISKIKFGCSQGLTSLVREEDLDSVPNPRYGNCKHLLSLKVRSVSLDSILYSLFYVLLPLSHLVLSLFGSLILDFYLSLYLTFCLRLCLSVSLSLSFLFVDCYSIMYS